MIVHLPDKQRFEVKELAKLLDKHVATIWRWILHGVRGHKLPAIYVGGRRYIRRDDAAAFLEKINQQPAAKTAGKDKSSQARQAKVERQLEEAGL